MKTEFNFKFLNKIMYIAVIIVLFYVFQNLGILSTLKEINDALIPVYLGLVVCFISMPIATKLRKLGLDKKWSAVLALMIIYAIIGVVIAMIIPVFTEQLTNLIDNFPQLYESIVVSLNKIIDTTLGFGESMNINPEFDGMAIINEYFNDVVNFSITTLQSIFNSIIAIFTVLIVSFFLVKDMEDIKDNFINFFSNGKRNKARYKLIKEIDVLIFSYIKGVFIDSVIVGILTTIVCMVLGLDYAIVFGILITLLNFIPYIGALLSELIIALYALTVGGPLFALLTFGLLLIVQLIDSNILQPNIVAKSVDLHPVLVFSGLLVGNILLGIFGMIIVVPVLAVCKIIFNYKFNKASYYEIEEDKNKKDTSKKTPKKKEFTSDALQEIINKEIK